MKNNLLQRLSPGGVSTLFLISASTMLLVIMMGISPVAAKSLGVFGDWSAFKTSENGKDVCYIGSEPKKAEGDYSNRGETYMLVTHRPAIDELNVVSVRAGYKYKENSEVSVVIDEEPLTMFALGDMAWARDADSDHTLVKAMRRGNKMIIRGTSWRGTQTTDTYSLRGFTRAYKKSLAACGIK